MSVNPNARSLPPTAYSLLLMTSCLLLTCSGVHAAPQSTNYQLSVDGIVSGGEQTNTSSHRLYRSCIGEPISNDVASPTMKLSEGLFVTQNQLNLLLPHKAPTVNPVRTPTAVSTQLLAGTKAQNTSLWLNGVQIIVLNANTSWSYTVSLVKGTNVLNVLTKDTVGNASATITTAIFLDTTPPTKPVVTDDGVYTTTFTQLHARWSSTDAESGIEAYQYRIGTTPTGSEVLQATSAGLLTEITKTGLALVQGQRYYLAVRAKNKAGSWSAWGVSDGIYANRSVPVISVFSPADASKFLHGDSVTLSATASDADGDTLEYQFSSRGVVKQSWSPLTSYGWLTTANDIGLKTIRVDVRDNHGGVATREHEIYVVRKPVLPP